MGELPASAYSVPWRGGRILWACMNIGRQLLAGVKVSALTEVLNTGHAGWRRLVEGQGRETEGGETAEGRDAERRREKGKRFRGRC